MIPVNSSNIAAVGYDGITLIHSGREYAYYVIFLTNSFVYKLFTVTGTSLSNDNITIRTIEFSHETENVFFSLHEESDGTARLLDLIEILFEVSNNNIYVIDEIDRCLHPAMTAKIVNLFLKMAESRNTQLIITTHESRLLKEDILRNDEISFMIKTPTGSTIIKSLEKYQLRADKKIYEALFDGTLEAIPNFNDKKIANIVQHNTV